MIIRSGRNQHRYIQFSNNRIVCFQTEEKDQPGWISGLGLKNALPLAVSALLAGMILTTANAGAELPTGYQTVSGSASFQNNGNSLTINASNRAIINYNTFNIGAGNTVNIISPLSLHRITGGSPSQILGALNATGKVFLINPSGIFFGAGSQVNVQGLVASTLNIRNDDFLAGNYTFQNDSDLPAGAIVNHGHIQASESIAMLAGAVENQGSIQAPQVKIAVGDQLTYHVNENIGIDITVDQSLKQKVQGYQNAILNQGSITGQNIHLQAKLAQSFYETTVNNTGIIKATGFAQDASGQIVAIGQTDDHTAVVQNAGQLLANGSDLNPNGGHILLEGDTTVNRGQIQAIGIEGGQGGTVHMLGDAVQTLSGSDISVSGPQGGGTVLIGGDYQGTNALIRNALFNYSDADTLITANALKQGNGGKVILWADKNTLFQGNIEAKGGAESGNGGLVETSGYNLLQATGSVDASAAKGKSGQWLLDPNNITIQNAGVETNVTSSGTNPITYNTSNNTAIVTSGTIQAALNNGTDVTIQTSTGGTNSQDGDITIAEGTTIAKTTGGDATLTLKAHNSIIASGTSLSKVTISSTNNKLNLVLNSNSDAVDSGAIALTHTNITTNDGSITMGGGTNPLTTNAIGTTTHLVGIKLDNTNLTAAAGNISLRGEGSASSTTSRHGIELVNTSQAITTTGNLTAFGKSSGGTTTNHGIFLNGSSAKLTTQTGLISLTGESGVGGSGIFINAGQITSSGTSAAGAITLNGTGMGISSTAATGITLLGSAGRINTVSGNVFLTGQGSLSTVSAPSSMGIYMDTGSQVNNTGDGTITLHGTGGTGTNALSGVRFAGGNTTGINSVNGNISITGQGGLSAAGNTSIGIDFNSGGTVRSTGNATITLHGTGGGNPFGNLNHGISLFGGNSVITSLNGNVQLTGIGGGGAAGSNQGISIAGGGRVLSTGSANISLSGLKGIGALSYGLFTNNSGTNAIGSNTMTGNITLAANDYSFTPTFLALRTSGQITFKPYTSSTSIGLNGGAGSLALGNTFLNYIDRATVTPSKVIFGDSSAGSGAVTITGPWDTSAYNMPLEVYGGSITTGSINNGSKSILLRALSGDLTLNGGTTLTSTATGNAIVLAAGNNLINSAGASALSAANGRWLVYSSNPANNTLGGLTGFTKRYNRTFGGNAPGTIAENGNVMMYSLAPTLTLSADNNNRLYGAANPTFTGGLSGLLVDGDTLGSAVSGSGTFSTLATSASDAGDYAISANLGTLTSELGYQFNMSPGTLTVNPAALTVTADNASRAYGASDPSFSASYSGFVLGQNSSVLGGSLGFSTPATSASNVGNYDITPSGFSSSNYDISYANGTLGVNPAALTVTADNASRLYGASNPSFNASYSGFVLGQDSSVLGGSLGFSTPATSASNVGNYDITPSGFSSSNYDISYANGTLGVNPAALTITADNASRLYGASNPSFNASYSGFVLGQDSSVLGGSLGFSTPANSASNVGDYDITPSGFSSSNYDISYANGTLGVNPAALTVTADNASRLYGASNPSFNASYSGFVLGQDSSVLGGSLGFSTPVTNTTAAGVYSLTPFGLSSTNYAISNVAGDFTILPATPAPPPAPPSSPTVTTTSNGTLVQSAVPYLFSPSQFSAANFSLGGEGSQGLMNTTSMPYAQSQDSQPTINRMLTQTIAPQDLSSLNADAENPAYQPTENLNQNWWGNVFEMMFKGNPSKPAKK
ncbi:beta strand repeat-containing protein [Vampirovibrio sp.]|uniref:beta strand repeat-containing protein n=1 Tax=Vampirovibrio sp. TaxID=2717857 RepID=UPI003593325A